MYSHTKVYILNAYSSGMHIKTINCYMDKRLADFACKCLNEQCNTNLEYRVESADLHPQSYSSLVERVK